MCSLTDTTAIVANYHQIKTELEETFENCDIDDKSIFFEESSLIKIENQLFNEPGAPHSIHKDELTFTKNNCKIEKDIETFDEFYHPDARSIYFEQFDKSTIKVEKAFDQSTGSSAATQSKHMNLDEDCEDHLETRPYKCNKCTFRAKTKRYIREHQQVHLNDKPFKCDKCSYRTNRTVCLNRHQAVHQSVRPFNCDKCDFSSKFKYGLRKHALVHQEVKPFKCDKCSFETKRQYTLQIHQMVIHQQKKLFECDNHDCVYRTNSESHMKRHKKLHTLLLKCHKCCFMAETNESLAKHQITHVEGEQSKMKIIAKCEKKLQSDLNLTKTIHNGELDSKPSDGVVSLPIMIENNNTSSQPAPPMMKVSSFKCHECFFLAKTKHHLISHLMRHKDISQVESFSCKKCNFVTKYKRVLLQHQVVHEKNHVFECNECDYKANCKTSLKRHQTTHGDLSDMKVYKCPFCDSTIKYQGYMKVHMLLHCKKLNCK